MARTFRFANSVSDLTLGGAFTHELLDTAAGTDQITAASGGGTNDGLFATGIGIPGIGGATGDYTVVLNVSTAASGTEARVTVSRYNAGFQASVNLNAGAYTSTATTGDKTFTGTGVNLGTWAAGDRLVVTVNVRNTNAHGGAAGPTFDHTATNARVDTPFSSGVTAINRDVFDASTVADSPKAKPTPLVARPFDAVTVADSPKAKPTPLATRPIEAALTPALANEGTVFAQAEWSTAEGGVRSQSISGYGGAVGRVSFFMARPAVYTAPSSDTVACEIRETAWDGSVVATSASVPLTTITSRTNANLDADWVEFLFASPPTLNAGTTYFLTLVLTSVDGNGRIRLRGSSDQYAGGSYYSNGSPIATIDLFFRVYTSNALGLGVVDDAATDLRDLRFSVNVADTITITDSATPALLGAALSVTRSDAISVTEATGRSRQRNINVADAVIAALSGGVTELTASVFDTLTVAEFHKEVLPELVQRLSETVTVAEFHKEVLPELVARLVDALTVSEFAKPVLPELAARLFDLVVTTEAAFPELRLVRLAAALSETISAVESTKTPLSPLVATLSDLITLLEDIRAVLPQLAVFSTDALTTVEDVVAELRTVRLQLLAFEVIGVSELAKAVITPLVARVSEAVALVDEATATMGIVSLNRALDEAISVAEFAKAVLAQLAVHAADETTLSDVLTAVLTPLIIQSFDAVTGTDAAKAVLPQLAVRATEILTLLEEVRALLPQLAAHPTDVVAVFDAVMQLVPQLAAHLAEPVVVAENVATMLIGGQLLQVLAVELTPEETVFVW